MTILNYEPSMNPQLIDMMVPYMSELNTSIPEEIIRGKLSNHINTLHQRGIIRISIALEEGVPAGFSVYQIDTPESDWCKRPGWGFIREYYVAPPYRKQGLGRQLAAHTEQCLRQMGAVQLYLTSTDAVPFWQRCGWTLTEELCSNGQYILEK